MPFAVLRWVGAAGERAAAVAGDQGQSLRPAGDPPAPAQFEDGSGGGEHGGDDVGVVGQLQQLGGWQHGAVSGSAVPDPVDQVLRVDGHDHRGRDTAGVGHISRPQLPVAQVFQGVMQPLSVGATVHRAGRVDPRLGQRIEQRLQLGAEAAGEPEVPDVGPVPGRAEMKVTPVLVELFVGDGPVRVDGIHDPMGEQLRSSGGNSAACSVRSFSPAAMSAGSKPRRSTVSRAPTIIATFSALTAPSRWAAAKTGRTGSRDSPSIDRRGPTASAARTRPAASRLDTLNTDVTTRHMLP